MHTVDVGTSIASHIRLRSDTQLFASHYTDTTHEPIIIFECQLTSGADNLVIAVIAHVKFGLSVCMVVHSSVENAQLRPHKRLHDDVWGSLDVRNLYKRS